MTCSCCETGRCCDGANCLSTTPSECAHRTGTFSSPGTCGAFACVENLGPAFLPFGGGACSVINQCQCDAKGPGLNMQGYTLRPPATSCDCKSLQDAGVFNGNCPRLACNVCDRSTGLCVNDCPSPRSCCGGVCCPLSQTCNAGNCVNKCGTGTTFCAGTGSAYACCSAGQKCCGSSGCLATSSTNFSVNVAVNDWVNTGVTVASGSGVTITATGSCDRCAAGTVEWSYAGSTATPNGVTSAPCSCCDSSSFSASFCHMALIGKIGVSGTPFLVGSSYSGTPGAGALYLRQNDLIGSDNRGAFTGTITTDPCPGYIPAAVGEPIVYGSGGKPDEPAPGPGAALKALLKLAGIVASPTCSCNARAAQMDAWGEWECLKRLPEITGWLKEEAEKRELWFFRPAGMALILAAISLSALKRPFRGINR